MKLYNTDAIVLRTRAFSEADNIITLYTLNRGKVQAIAKGSRKTNSRKKGAVQPFTYGNFLLYQGRSMDTVSQCEAKESFAHLREDLVMLALATYFTELVEGFAVEGETNGELFILLLTSLHLLMKDEPRILARTFELRLLNVLGYCPELQVCASCGENFPSQKGVVFSTSIGGILCPECQGDDSTAVPVQPGTIQVMKQLLKWDIRRLHVIKVPDEILKEMAALLKRYINERVEKRLKTTDFLETVLS